MSAQESVSQWIEALQAGDQAAAQKLWERYFQRLVGLARKKLQGTPRRAADEEDVALNTFASFCRGAEQGRFPQLHDRHGLWRLLVTITARKSHQLAAHESCQKRGGVNGHLETMSADYELARILDREPTPEFAAQMAEECGRLLASLPDAELRSVAQWKVEGYTNEEIADKLGCVVRSVERKLRVVRSLWTARSAS